MPSMIYDLTSGGEEEDDAAWATDTASFMNEFLSRLPHTFPSPVKSQRSSSSLAKGETVDLRAIKNKFVTSYEIELSLL